MSEHGGSRAAIIGAGLMGRWHADAVSRIGGQVTVIVDPDERAREALGRRYPAARLLPELDLETVARHAIAAHVCTPLATHVPIVTRLVEAGIHALVEKPFADTARDTASVLEIAGGRHVIVCPVHQFLFQAGVRRIVEWLPKLGAARRIEFSTCSAGAALDDPAALDDLIVEILPHPLSLVALILQASLADVGWQVAHPVPGELHAVATVGTTIVDVAISAHGRPTENVIRVVGDSGSATADLFHGFAVRHGGAVSRRSKAARPFVLAATTLAGATVNLARRAVSRELAYPGLRELVRQFYAAIHGARPSPISADQTLDVAAARDRLVGCIRAE
jgi:predicted dehydrogenase